MAKIDIIYQGDTGKYQLIIERDGFNPQTCDFRLTLSWGFRGEHKVIKKDEMFHDEEWNVFFMFDSSKMLGKIAVECEYWVADSDIGYPAEGDATEEAWFRVNVDRQVLCLVSTSATACVPKVACKCPCGQEHFVHYQRTLRSDANSLYAIVRDNTLQVIRTSDGNIVRVKKHNLN